VFNITFADAQLTFAGIVLVAFVVGRLQRGLFRLLSEPNTSSHRLFYEPHTVFKRRN
jgi:hypothetical protein